MVSKITLALCLSLAVWASAHPQGLDRRQAGCPERAAVKGAVAGKRAAPDPVVGNDGSTTIPGVCNENGCTGSVSTVGNARKGANGELITEDGSIITPGGRGKAGTITPGKKGAQDGPPAKAANKAKGTVKGSTISADGKVTQSITTNPDGSVTFGAFCDDTGCQASKTVPASQVNQGNQARALKGSVLRADGTVELGFNTGADGTTIIPGFCNQSGCQDAKTIRGTAQPTRAPKAKGKKSKTTGNVLARAVAGHASV
ncbi:hypothetical protein DFS34DRAFT_636737 [Phlyctochytrium arcticum]|nr:hypothetical protein DFS34DRAFT_636737 [Phlyctochytrium arcticum]